MILTLALAISVNYYIDRQPLNCLGVHLDRQQAMTMLKKLVANNLVEPSYVSISERKPKDYQIQIKCDYNRLEIEAHAKNTA